MRLDDERASSNVEDRRQQGGGFGASGGRGGINPMGLIGLLAQGKKGVVMIVIILLGSFFGFDLAPLFGLQGSGLSPRQAAAPAKVSAQEQELNVLARKVLTTTERIWTQQFQAWGKSYRMPTMVLYRGATKSACGMGQSAMGPFYCPADEKIYLDLSFYDDMKNQLKADGDFAFAYVIAHEVGHHVQNLLGISGKSQQAQRSASSKKLANQISVKVELQADCFAGVWGHYVQKEGRLDDGDIIEAFNAAEAVGDDRLQEQAHGHVVPDSFTHGSSAERLQWFKVGLKSGNPNTCDTFKS